MSDVIMSEDKLYLENLEEEVLTKHNVITYKWLVRNLKVNVNTAKRMLFEFVEKQKSTGVEVHSTYLVAGLKKRADGVVVHEVALVPSADVEKAKSTYTLVTSVHVYAVHKGPIKDGTVFHAADYDADYRPAEFRRLTGIRYEAATFRSKVLDSTPFEQPIVSRNDLPKPDLLVCSKNKSNSANQKKKSNDSCKSTVLSAMFQNATKKQKQTSENNEAKRTDSVISTPDEESQTCDGSTLSSPEAKENSAIVVHDAKQTVEKPLTEENRIEKTKEETVVSKKRVQKRKSNSERKTGTRTAPKKRRRIIQAFSSSSEDEDDVEEMHEDEQSESRKNHRRNLADLISEDDEDPVPLKVREMLESDEVSQAGQKTKKSIVENTVVDEDGFLVTKKVWEHVSVQDDEEPIPKKSANVEPVSKKRDKPHSKPQSARNKQSNIMSFFSRK